MSGRKRRWETVIVWFRRDLRLSDHPALDDATAHARAVVPLFVLQQRLLDLSPARSWFLSRSIEALAEELRRRGSGLVVRAGDPEEVVARVAHEVRADAVLATRDVTPFSFRRDRAVSQALQRDGRKLHLRPGLLLVEPEGVRTAAAKPYAMFTPFWRALQPMPRRALLSAPAQVPAPPGGLPATELTSFVDATPRPGDSLPEPGEHAADDRLRRWIAEGLVHYGDRRDDLGGETTSHLGADLHLGLLSPLQVEGAALELGHEATPFIRQLAWREFYQHLLFHGRDAGSRTSKSPFMAAFRSEADDPESVAAWRAGMTGIPVVDAGMRQLAATAWLSNRARLVAASFLTRHLLMDYRIGERHFLRHLIDGDVANNLGGWQWTAGVGTDAQPWFRIFNPVRQGRRFDAEGGWTRRWVPELAQVPARYIHAPWEMPADVASDLGIVLGSTYPRPIVDLAEGRERALAAFRSISS